jgi:flavin reductase (DIM6/NTAB) family NADH-FMN oxidoreductase RutF
MPKRALEPQTMLLPLPAVMVSCQRGKEKPNIITLSWVGVVCSEPPMVGLAIRKNRYSFNIIKESGTFVVNVPKGDLLKATDFCGITSGKDTDKFKEAKLTPVECTKTGAPLIQECPVNLECELRNIFDLGSHSLFVGEIVATHVDSEYLNDKGQPDVEKMKLFCYCPKAHQYRAVGDVLALYGQA